LSVRYADAFVMLAEQFLDDQERSGRVPVGIDLVMDVQALFERTGLDVCGARCDLEGYGPIGRAVVERLACEASVARVVMAGKSVVLDLGRRSRVVSPELRRAVELRDRHCQGRGCRTPAKWCDVHHIIHWIDGGETTLDNLVLLCRRHHVEHHEGGWRIARAPDGTITTTRTVPERRGRTRRRRQSRPGRSDL
jgi:hypothetical protein